MEDVIRSVRKKGNEEYVTLVYPGGSAMMYGGTRIFNPAFHLNRWWQHNTRIEEGRKHFACELHSKPQNVISPLVTVGDGFTLIRNSNTPHYDHRLFFPHGECWPEEKIRTLGGLNNIHGLLDYTMAQMRTEKQPYTRLLCYVGPLMGMNQMDYHVHWLVNPDNEDPNLPLEGVLEIDKEAALRNFWRKHSKLMVSENDGVRIVSDSIFRAGQCFLVTTGVATSTQLAESINSLLLSFAKVFTSHQGWSPDIVLMLEFRDGIFEWGYCSPYLNHIGYEQQTGFRRGVYVHPWGPELTHKLLIEAT